MSPWPGPWGGLPSRRLTDCRGGWTKTELVLRELAGERGRWPAGRRAGCRPAFEAFPCPRPIVGRHLQWWTLPTAMGVRPLMEVFQGPRDLHIHPAVGPTKAAGSCDSCIAAGLHQLPACMAALIPPLRTECPAPTWRAWQSCKSTSLLIPFGISWRPFNC